MVKENKNETRNCILFFGTLSLGKNKSLNSDKNKQNPLTEMLNLYGDC